MLDYTYYNGFEGEGMIAIWCGDPDPETSSGMAVWEGYFDTIVEGCYTEDHSPDGIIVHCNKWDGFYDDVWEMRHPDVVLDELRRFDEGAVAYRGQLLITGAKKVLERLIAFILSAVRAGQRIYVEYD